MTERKILITGGLGYLGTTLVPAIAKLWPVRVFDTIAFGNSIENTPNVEFIQGDILDYLKLGDVMQGCTDVIHLAGIVTDELVDMNVDKGKDVNIHGTASVVTVAARYSVKRFIYASSSSVYGSTETISKETDEPKPMTEYAKTKLIGENVVIESNDAVPGFTTCAVRMATLCGPAPRMRLDTIVNIFSKQAYFDKEITVFGGDQFRSNLHVDDARDFYIKLLEAEPNQIAGEIFNVTSGNGTAERIARDVVIAYNSIYGYRLPVRVDHDKKDDRHYKMTSQKARTVLDWYPRKTIMNAAKDNFAFFEAGEIFDPEDDIYYNTKRMRKAME